MAAGWLGQLADCLCVYAFLAFYLRMFGWRWGRKPYTTRSFSGTFMEFGTELISSTVCSLITDFYTFDLRIIYIHVYDQGDQNAQLRMFPQNE